MRIWISATWRSKSRAMRLCPSNFKQCILVSTRLRRWYPLNPRQSARPRYRDALIASFRAMAPAFVGFRGMAFLRGGNAARVLRAATAIAVTPCSVLERPLCGLCRPWDISCLVPYNCSSKRSYLYEFTASIAISRCASACVLAASDRSSRASALALSLLPICC